MPLVQISIGEFVGDFQSRLGGRAAGGECGAFLCFGDAGLDEFAEVDAARLGLGRVGEKVETCDEVGEAFCGVDDAEGAVSVLVVEEA